MTVSVWLPPFLEMALKGPMTPGPLRMQETRAVPAPGVQLNTAASETAATDGTYGAADDGEVIVTVGGANAMTFDGSEKSMADWPVALSATTPNTRTFPSSLSLGV